TSHGSIAFRSSSAFGGSIALDLTLLAAAALPLGSFWYLRNWELTGNPLFPLRVTAAGVALFSGAHGRAEMLQSHFHVPLAAAAERKDFLGLLFSAGTALALVGSLVRWGPFDPLDARRELFSFPWVAIGVFSLAGGALAGAILWRRRNSSQGGVVEEP